MRIAPMTALVAAAALAPPTAQEVVAYKAKTLIVSPTRTLARGVLLVRGGKVADCGIDLPLPAETRIVDLGDVLVAPGFVDAWSRLGTGDEGMEMAEPFTPTLKMADGLDLSHRKWALYAALGVTSVVVAPDPRQVAGGLSCLVKTGPRPQVVESSLGLQLSLGGDARMMQRPPTSLPGQLALIRSAFGASAKRKKPVDRISSPRDRIMAKALAGRLAVAICCGAPHEVVAAANLAGETGPKPFLVGAMEHRRTAAILGAAGLGAVLLPAGAEAPAWRLRLPGAMAAAGVPVAFGSGLPGGRLLSFRSRPARAVHYGMKKSDAYAAVTSTPAGLLGLSHMIGTLEKGRDADFIVLDGHPLNPASRIEETYIEGRRVFHAAAHGKEAEE